MSAPSHDDDQLKLEIFDSFSKTVMRNASRNFAAAAKTRKKNESVNTDIVQYILNVYFRDFRNIADLQTLRVRTEEKRICKYSQLLRKDTKA